MPVADYSIPACPDCDALTLPTVDFAECDIESRESEICTIYMALDDPMNPGNPAGTIDMSTPAGITTAVTAGDLIVFTVIGDAPEPEQTTRVVSKRRTIMGKKTFTINATVDDMNDTNYEALRELECGGSRRIWLGTIGGRLFGDPTNGILADVSKSNPMVLDRGEDTYERGEMAFTWEMTASPPRGIDPLGALYVAP